MYFSWKKVFKVNFLPLISFAIYIIGHIYTILIFYLLFIVDCLVSISWCMIEYKCNRLHAHSHNYKYTHTRSIALFNSYNKPKQIRAPISSWGLQNKWKNITTRNFTGWAMLNSPFPSYFIMIIKEKVLHDKSKGWTVASGTTWYHLGHT